MVYQHAPAVVRKRADEVVALVKPSLCAAAETKEAKKLRDSGSEAYTAFVTCVAALWSFFEPAIAALIFDVASAVRDRRRKASGVETHVIGVADNMYGIAETCVIKSGEYVASYGHYPKLAVDHAEMAAKWVARKSEVLENPETDADGKVAYKNAKEAVTAPRASISAAIESTEGQRFRKAAYAVLLAIVACVAALMGAVIPVLAGFVAWVVAAYWERRDAATGLDSWVLSLFHSFWNLIEKVTSTGVQLAESYEGPGSLTLLQIATAMKMFVEWLKEAGEQGVKEAEKTPPPSMERKVAIKAEEVVHKAEEVVEKVEAVMEKVEAMVDEAESVTKEKSTVAPKEKNVTVETVESTEIEEVAPTLTKEEASVVAKAEAVIGQPQAVEPEGNRSEEN